uniref:Uncharacterized protein n=2 Tax=Nicotiana TaxID=4085 RepID=A0A1S3YZX4_TOBAC|nr:PREDICTED: putative uncharacterized protein DDB_G0271982 isoform X1 [Nicotiana sylvestris]XP_009760905.1 PREDICTED: putative uncharacterized protein DDB_G0271982 isoform X1 [Nicotiana sylvestris]XP_009760906.1 PREDICTED: putative uncharacterized protein DDB_G0271982 isoform X1 [Nicotiana sylvestris]XP_016457673.1 PREDICTED: putative uncharacterized protein DDB_G0271982 isoform X1 [Nicotiana tabacum]XP_016457674.1 PREDICTED: putative uncharacterized protein DDB_G0271982 isoform X1 [Nicotiana 
MAKGCVSKTGGGGRDKSPSKRSIKRIKTSQEDELQKSIVAEVEAKPLQVVEVVEGENAGEEEKEKENEQEIEKENTKETENVLGGNAREEEIEKEKEEEKEETTVDEGEEETDIDDEASVANTEEKASREEEEKEKEAATKRRKKRKNDNAPSQSVEDEMPEDEFDSCEVEILKLRSELPPLKYKTFLDDNETFNKKITVRSLLGLAGMGEFRKLLQDEGLKNKFRSSPFRHFGFA